MDGRLAAITPAGVVHWLHTDHQGSVIASSNSSGAPVSFANYSPFGELGTTAAGAALTAPPTGSPFGYTGRQYDPETGLWQYRARYYHPRLGQFMSTDPIGTQDDPNLYLYVGLDPVNKTDATGEQTQGAACAAGAAIGAPAAGVGAVPGCVVGVVVSSAATVAVGACTASQGCRDAVGAVWNWLTRPLHNDADAPEERQPGERELGELESIHPPGSNPDTEEKLGNMTDDEVMDTIVNPTSGDRVTVRGDSPRVRDGNTRVREAQRRFPSDTRIPVDVLPPDREFP